MVLKTLAATSGSVILVVPTPLEPNTGFTMTSSPSSWKHLSASSWLSVTAVRGTGMLCSWKSVSEQYLSTDRSMAMGGLMISSPDRSSLWRRFILKMISSSIYTRVLFVCLLLIAATHFQYIYILYGLLICNLPFLPLQSKLHY